MQSILTILYDNQIIFLQLTLSLLLGMSLGVQRTVIGKNAGMRTYALVSMGCALLVIVGQSVIASYPAKTNFDPLSLTGSVIQGIGFLGAGLIILHGTKVSGLTTAAGLWLSAVIGITVGYNMLSLAVFATIATLLTFTFLWTFEEKIRSVYAKENGDHQEISD